MPKVISMSVAIELGIAETSVVTFRLRAHRRPGVTSPSSYAAWLRIARR